MVCASCGFVSGPRDLICPRCGLGDTSENPAPNWSGYGQTAPMEVEDLGWHWGAALGSWLWCFRHGMPGLGSGLLFLILARKAVNIFFFPNHWFWPSRLMAVFLIGLCVHLGLNGHRFAWMHRHYPGGLPEFYETERRWVGIGAAVFAATLLALVLADLQILRVARRHAAMERKARLLRPHPAAHGPLTHGPRPARP